MTENLSVFESLAAQVTQEAQLLTTYLNENGYYQPDFKPGGFTEFDELPPEVEASRKRLQAAAKAVQDLAAGPERYMKNLATSYHDSTTLRWLIHFKIFENIPLGRGELITYSGLAKKCNVNETILRRIIKYAITNHIFYEPSPNEVAQTAYSAVLVTDPELRAEIAFEVEEGLPVAANLVEAHEKWDMSDGRRNRAAFQISNGTDLDVGLEFYKQDGMAERMEGFLAARPDEGVEEECLMKAYPWEKVKRIVDVGGSKGETAVALAKRFSGLRIMVVDSEASIDVGKEGLPEELERKVYFVGCDIFREDGSMPDEIFGAQVYLLRNVLGKCSEERAKIVLSNVAEVLQDAGEGAKCLIVDRVLPSSPSPFDRVAIEDEKAARHMDLHALEMGNGAERNGEEWETLLSAADEGLRLVDIRVIDESAYSILEVVYVDSDD
ncbi:O-methyltransferase VdtC [Pseudocercospora fuligena]|uniref:O-methyltransferase VdtC n=1 Tax=Pseudocercospora fuligena TaxID=685502 RepID=A0A8H6R4D1_9PEZI|nr:O-methyltransferase VdtC [Pseudocercospora fuligena]